MDRPSSVVSTVMLASAVAATLGLATASCPDSVHYAHLGVCHCTCVLIDVGLNTGKSLREWAREAAPQVPTSRLRECAESADTCYYGFEANPRFDSTLTAKETKMRSAGKRVRLFTGTAFNTHDQPTTFLVDRNARMTSEGVATGSTLEGDMMLTFMDKDGKWRHNPNKTVAERYKRETVRSIDASAFLSAVLAASDWVGMKLDIEGFEYALLPHLLVQSPRALCGLKVLAIEWHPVPKQSGANEHLSWLLQQPACNVTLVTWH